MTPLERAALWVASALLLVLGVGLAVLPLETPGFTEAVSARFSRADEAGLTRSESARLAEQVRAFVIGGDGRLPATYAGRPAFDRAAVAHLEDVRDVVAGARTVTLVLALLAIAGAVAAWRIGRLDLVGSALRLSGAVLIGAVVSIGLWALVDFDGFFAAFHGLFFAEGTWTFPYDSLLIRLFPEGFWVTGAVAWAVTVVAVGAVYVLLGGVLRGSRRASTNGRAE